MAESKRIYLMRHAKPELPFGGRVYYGRTDFPLSAEGRAAAAKLGEHLRGRITFDALYTSGMKRAVETASLAVPGMTGTAVPELREVDLGDWDGRSYDEVREQFREIYERRGVEFARTAPPCGESFEEMQRRTVPAFEKIVSSHESGNILIVAHGGAIWSIVARLFGLDLNDMFFFPLDYCGIDVVEPSCGRWRLVRYNWTPETERL